MRYILTNLEFLTEELKKTPTAFTFTKDKDEDRKHNRLAAKKEDGHAWKKIKSKKSGKIDAIQEFGCKCGYRKIIKNDDGKKVSVEFSK